MKKIIALLLVVAMMLCLVACNGKDNDKGTPGSDGEPAAASNTLSVCLASEPDTIDPALNSSVDGGTMCAHLFAGISHWAQDAPGHLEPVADLAEDLPEGVVNDDGTVTYTYTLREGLKWSDGEPLTAGDFVFAWNRAASAELGADYGYMMEVIDGYDEVSATNDDGTAANPDAKLNIEAPDDRTLVVTLANEVPYWNELMAFPTYYPVREDVVADEGWATEAASYVGNGPYTLTGWEHNSVITMTKNENYYDAENVTMDTLNFYLSDDSNNMLANFKSGDWQLIDDVPTNEISTLKTEYPDEFVVAGQIGTYYVCWNINEQILPADSTLTGDEAEKAKEEIRNAIALLFDRNYLVEEVAQGGQVPASSFVAMGLTNPDGTQFYETAGHDDSYPGYYDVSEDSFEANFSSAIETLKKYYTYDESAQKFTNFPSLTYIYNTNDSHKAIAEYLQGALSTVGIDMKLENQEWNTFLNTRKQGDYSIARNGWLADYNDPISFLDMWISTSGNNDVQFGKGENANVAIYNLDLTPYGYDTKVENGTWAETYDVLISTIKSCTDTDNRYAMMHMAEDMLMETGCIVPLYFYTDLYMLDDSVHGFYSNPLGFKYFMHCTIG